MTHRIYLTLLSLLALVACSKAPAEDARWRSDVPTPKPSPSTETEASLSHHLLIEKYTGQECVNCPTAASLLEGLEAAHPDRLIIVSMHAAYTGQTLPELRSDAADSYAKAFRIPRSIPGIMLDRRPLASGERYSTSSAQWTGEILRALKAPSPLSLSLQVSGAELGSAWTCQVALSPVSKSRQSASSYRLTLWVVEDILAPQQTAGGLLPAFKHHNVLRAELTSEVIPTGKPYSRTFPIPEGLRDKAQAKVVAFVTDLETGQVLDARLVQAPGARPAEPSQPDKPSEEKPEETVQAITFLDPATGKTLPSGSVLTCSPSRPLELLDGVAEVASPYVKLLLPKDQPGPFDIEVIATSAGVGKESHGLSGVCLESCTTLEALSSSYQVRDYRPQPTDLIGVHYGLRPAWARKVGTYEARLQLKQSGKAVASLTYRFVITAKDLAKEEPRPEKPQPPKPEPQPVPAPQPNSPTPTPNPPSAGDDIPEAKKTHVVAFDFTGQRCGYCYSALDNMGNAQAALGEYFLPVAIQSRSYRDGLDLLCDDYWMYHSFYHPSGYPNVFVANDKEKVYHSYVQGHAKGLIDQKPSVKIRLMATNTPTHVSVHFKALPNDGMTPPQELEVLFLLLQSNMIAYQVNKSSTYSHQHVLRRGLNNRVDPNDWQKWTWGSSYTFGQDFSATYKLEDARYPGSQAIVPKDCEVIALLLDAKTKKVLNAAAVHLK